MQIRVLYGKTMLETCFYVEFSIIDIVSPSNYVYSCIFSVSIFWPIRPVEMKKQFLEVIFEKWVKFIEKACFISTFALFPLENSVQTVKIIGSTCILCQSNFLNAFYAEFNIINIVSPWKLCQFLLFHCIHTWAH